MGIGRATMRAAVIERFGGPEELTVREVGVPPVAAGEVLIEVHAAGVGQWDPFERDGGYAEMLGTTPRFPYVLGSEGAGVVVAVGAGVDRVRVGDEVFAVGFLNPKGGFYAEYAVVDADLVSPRRAGLTVEQAAAMGGVGTTALRGLDDVLALEPEETLLVAGAGGGVGHVAVQLAKLKGARVLAVASGADGVALAARLGADAAVDGRSDDVGAAAAAFAGGGVDAALLTAGGAVADAAVAAVRPGGRVAFPVGIHPEPGGRPDVDLRRYFGEPDRDIVERFERAVSAGPFTVEVARAFPLDRAADAHRALEGHYLGKLVLRVG